MRNGKIITAWTALAIIAAAPTAANAQTAAPNVQPIAPAPPEPRSCQQLHEERTNATPVCAAAISASSPGCRRGVSVMRNDYRKHWGRASADSRKLSPDAP